MIKSLLAATALAFSLGGCTSLGHQDRSVPQIAKPIPKISAIAIDGDDHALAVGVEKLLDARGIRAHVLAAPRVQVQQGDRTYTYDEVQSRYVVRVRSVDLDTCLPEGSRQMHFHLSVMDYQTRTRVFLLDGEFGCRDTLLTSFGNWLSGPN